MILTVIVLTCLWIGVALNIFQVVLKGTPFDFLPWNLVGVGFFICGYCAIFIRARSCKGWKVLEFPAPGMKLGISAIGANITFETLLPSIAGYLKTKEDKYYKDNAEGAYNCGGHDTRLIDGETSYVIDTVKARFVGELKKDYYDYDSMVSVMKKIMSDAKDKQGAYILTGKADERMDVSQIDIIHNSNHREFFELLCKRYVRQIHGESYDLKAYKRFQDKQSAPYNIGSIIHYIKALTYMKAVGIRKGMGGAGKYILIFVFLIIVIAVLFLIGSGTIKIPGLN